jgi:hypothetical protein
MEDHIAQAAQARRGCPFLNTEQTAFYIGIGTRTVATMRSTGAGPVFRRHGRSVRYHVADVIAWSKANAYAVAGRPDGAAPSPGADTDGDTGGDTGGDHD